MGEEQAGQKRRAGGWMRMVCAVMVGAGAVLLYRSAGPLWLELQLTGDKGGVVSGQVKEAQEKNGRYDLSYVYNVGGEGYRGTAACRCETLEGYIALANISIRYAKKDPSVNSPRQLAYYRGQWAGETATGAILAVLGVALLLRPPGRNSGAE